VATLLVMCDQQDLGTAIGERPPDPADSGSHGRGPVGLTQEFGSVEGFARTPLKDWASARTGKEFFEPNLYLYDAYPGGIGFSEPLFRAHYHLVQKTRELISGCECEDGCPSCIGPAGGLAPRAKEAALAILDRLCG
jgi:DEAD/DEAH box helicase domain-containing protein